MSREDFERRVTPLRGDLYFAAFALARREADAHDLVQETLLKAWRGFDGFGRGDHLKAWLFTILRNAWVDRCRQRRLEPAPLDPSLDPPAEPTGLPLAPEDALPDDLRAALHALTPAHRLVLLLRDVEGLSYREIAETLGCPIGSVMSGLHNARSRLKEKLLERRGEPQNPQKERKTR